MKKIERSCRTCGRRFRARKGDYCSPSCLAAAFDAWWATVVRAIESLRRSAV